MVGVVRSAGALVSTEGDLGVTYGLSFSLCTAPLNTPALDLRRRSWTERQRSGRRREVRLGVRRQSQGGWPSPK